MTELTVRRAGPHDVGALVEQRAILFAAMGRAPTGPDAPWRPGAADWFASWMDRPRDFAAFVAEQPPFGIVAGAAGVVESRTPSPDNDGWRGHLFNVATLPDHRNLGAAGLCVTALLAWFRTDSRLRVLQLDATEQGTSLYRRLGFVEATYPSMVLRIA